MKVALIFIFALTVSETSAQRIDSPYSSELATNKDTLAAWKFDKARNRTAPVSLNKALKCPIGSFWIKEDPTRVPPQFFWHIASDSRNGDYRSSFLLLERSKVDQKIFEDELSCASSVFSEKIAKQAAELLNSKSGGAVVFNLPIAGNHQEMIAANFLVGIGSANPSPPTTTLKINLTPQDGCRGNPSPKPIDFVGNWVRLTGQNPDYHIWLRDSKKFKCAYRFFLGDDSDLYGRVTDYLRNHSNVCYYPADSTLRKCQRVFDIRLEGETGFEEDNGAFKWNVGQVPIPPEALVGESWMLRGQYQPGHRTRMVQVQLDSACNPNHTRHPTDKWDHGPQETVGTWTLDGHQIDRFKTDQFVTVTAINQTLRVHVSPEDKNCPPRRHRWAHTFGTDDHENQIDYIAMRFTWYKRP